MSASQDERLSGWLRALIGRPGIVLAALWGAAEATFFFVVPDVLFTLVTVFRPARSLAHVAAALGGALLAGCAMFAWAARAPDDARPAVAAVPWVGAAMVAETDARFAEIGTTAMLDRPLGGVPYKVYAVLGPAHFSFPQFLGASFLARTERFAIAWAGFVLLWLALARRPESRGKLVLGIHGVIWSLVYGYYWFLR
jgi:hypothetical protein